MYWNKRIKDLREDNDLTKQELADKLDISERTLTRYETGESEPTISVLIKMSLIFNVSLDYIVGLSNNKSKTFRLTNSNSCTNAINTKKTVFAIKDNDDIISGDYIPEEIRKKMLIDRQSIINRTLVSNPDNSRVTVNRSCGYISNMSTSMVFKNKYKELIQNFLSAS